MKLQFDANQDYQKDAIKSVVDLFEGQPLAGSRFDFSLASGGLQLTEKGVGNRLTLEDEQLLANVQKVQERNGISQSAALAGRNFSVEMETGTGKTYVYLRTIYELNKAYGFKKFVIVVPSIAIREGVLKNLKITHDHFQMLYDKTPTSFLVYNSKKVSNLRGFALGNAIQILVINIDSFAKDENIINNPNDRMTGNRPIEFIQATNPIVIVDEPQNMETELRKKAIANLKPLCTLRYSATHTNLYNLVYSLNPVQAYDLGLVKQIEVDSIITEQDNNGPFIQVESFVSGKRHVYAKLKIDVNTDKGVARKIVTAGVIQNDSLWELSKRREVYRGIRVNGIDTARETVVFSNGLTMQRGETTGGLTDSLMRRQVESTIIEHLRKQVALEPKGLKVISLFFIDRVANYRFYDESGNPHKGKIAQWFEELYSAIILRPEFQGKISLEAQIVHNGYFAQDKKGTFKESSEGRQTEADQSAYELIMKDKEKLLDINEPLRFIFSHSALREGWDNPNVFQICVLKETVGELPRRQQIGRGLRLAVDQQGVRVHDKNINLLTVVANERESEFIKALQTEIESDCGVKFEGRAKSKKDRRKIAYRKGFEIDPKFLDIWNRINANTKYNVNYNADELVRKAAKLIKEMPVMYRPIIIERKTRPIVMDKEGIIGDVKHENKWEVNDFPFGLPDIFGYLQNKTELTRGAIGNIISVSGRMNDLLLNPQLFLDSVAQKINEAKYELMIDGIKYIKIAGSSYEMCLFEENEVTVYIERLFTVKDNSKTIYEEFIPLDSGVESDFAKDCEGREDVEFYFKLPTWFKIKTPIGEYCPDWALIFKQEKRVYFVAETKGSKVEKTLRPEELQKVKCGRAHFKEFEGVTYQLATSVSDLTPVLSE